MKIAVVQDIGTASQNVTWETDDEDAAIDFAASLRRQLPAHTWTVHPFHEVADTTMLYQMGEGVPMRPDNAARFVRHG